MFDRTSERKKIYYVDQSLQDSQFGISFDAVAVSLSKILLIMLQLFPKVDMTSAELVIWVKDHFLWKK